MPQAFLGRGAFVSLGEEVTWANAVAGTVSQQIASESLSRNQERSQKTHLSTSLGAFAFSPAFDGFEICEGDLSVPISYNGSGMLLKAACGDVSSSAGPPYTHTYTPGTTGDLPSLTVFVQRGNGSKEQFVGCIVSTMSLSIEAGGQMMCDYSLIGKTSNNRIASPALTPVFNASNKEVFHYEASRLFFNGIYYDLRSMNLTIDNKVERRNLLGSKLTSQPSITDLREITLECTADYENDNLYTAQLNGTIDNVEIEFTNSISESIKFILTKCQLTSYSDPVTTVGRIEQTFTFQGFAAVGGADAFTIEIVNSEASGIAN